MSKPKEPNLSLPVGSLESYRNSAFAIPMLTPEEEKRLAVQYAENNDLHAAWKLVLAHLRFVVRVARGYSGYGLAESDLIQEGNIGLMKAVKRFDPTMGVRLVSFAVHWIKAEMHEFILRNWRIVKVATTKAQRKLFFNLRSSKKRLGWMKHEEVKTIASDLGVPEASVLEMEKRLSSYDPSFDATVDDDDDRPTPSAFLEDLSLEPAKAVENEDWDNFAVGKLEDAIDTLDERSKHILQARWLQDKKRTLHDLADEYGVSAERIRQIEQQAMVKIKKQIGNALA